MDALPPINKAVLYELNKPRAAYRQEFPPEQRGKSLLEIMLAQVGSSSPTTSPPATGDGAQEQAIDRVIQTYKTEIQNKVDYSKDYQKVVDKLRDVEQFMGYDFSKFDTPKRKIIAEIFNDYAVALKLLKGESGNNDFTKVVDLYRLSMQLDPENYEPRFNLAFLIWQKRLGNYREALALVDDVLNNQAKYKLPDKMLRRTQNLKVLLEKLI